MATGNVEERLRRLEEAHVASDPTNNQSPLICKASVELQQQVNDLGAGYNQLEEGLHAFEQAHNREMRARKAEQHVSPPRGESEVKQSIETPNPTDTASGQIVATSIDQKTVQALLEDMTKRLNRFEQSTNAAPLAASTTHEVAQDLLRRLGNGDKLEHIVHLQLQTSLSGRLNVPLTPTPTDTSRAASSNSAGTHENRSHQDLTKRTSKRKAEDRPETEPLPKRKAEDEAEYAPALKRTRGRPTKRLPSDSSVEEPVTRRMRGRPPTHGRYARKVSVSSNVSGSIDSRQATHEPLQATRRVASTRLVSLQAERSSTDEEPANALASFKSNTKSEGNTSEKAVQEPERTAASRKDSVSTNTERSSNRWSIPSSTSPEPSDTSPSENVTEHVKNNKSLTCDAPSSQSIAVTGRAPKPATPEAGDISQNVSSESIDDGKTTSPSYRSTDAPELTAMEQSSADGVSIPPERRSGRKPKPTKHFGDVVSWKEASAQVSALRPSALYGTH